RARVQAAGRRAARPHSAGPADGEVAPRARPLRRARHRARARLGRRGGRRPRPRAAPRGGPAVSAPSGGGQSVRGGARGVSRLEADFCVVGAGAGGAVAAAELAEGGARVVLLEQGPWHDPDAFTARPPQMIGRLYRDGGQTATLGSPPILMPLGRGLGGTTLINSGTCFRTPLH